MVELFFNFLTVISLERVVIFNSIQTYVIQKKDIIEEPTTVSTIVLTFEIIVILVASVSNSNLFSFNDVMNFMI